MKKVRMERKLLFIYRTWLLGVAMSLSFCWIGLSALIVNAQGNPIVAENLQAGTDGWEIDQPSDDVTMQIKGFASLTSVNVGEPIDFHISVNPAQSFTIDVYRMGWYNGQGGRLMESIGPLSGSSQPLPLVDNVTGLVTAPWSSSYTLQIPTDWTSGVYLAKLINDSGYASYIIFVVRNDNNAADFLYQHPATTAQAYNNFPDDGATGKSLYRYNSYGANTIMGDKNAVKVSFDRPYAGRGAGLFLTWEIFLIQWLEKEGYSVTYSTNIDQHNNGTSLLNYKGFISAGHDEYWTKELFDSVENARDAGVHLFFTGANAAYWQSRLESNDRVLVVYKKPSLDPEPNRELKTLKFRDLGRAEQTLMGIQFKSHNDSWSANTTYIVQNSDYWVYENTNLSDGDSTSRIVGYEIDTLDPNYPGPPDNGTQVILSNSPFVNSENEILYAESSIYQARSGAWIFATGTSSWSWALANEGYINAGIQQTTANVLNRFLTDVPVEEPFVVGDVDCDEGLSAVDSLYILQHTVNSRNDSRGCPLEDPNTQLYVAAGDVNSTGTTDVIDGLLVLQCVVGISNSFCGSGLDTASEREDAGSSVSDPVQIFIQTDERSLSIQLIANNAIAGAGTFELYYDSAVSQLTACDTVLAGICHEAESGVVRFSFIEPQGLTDTHSLATLTFTDAVEFKNLQVINLVDTQVQNIAAEITSNQNEEQPTYSLFLPLLRGQSLR